MLELNDLLAKAGVDPAGCMVMRHRPTEPALRQQLGWMAAERPALFNAYQSHHYNAVVEKALQRAEYLVSTIGHEAGRALFVGIFAVRGAREISLTEFLDMPENVKLAELGTRMPDSERAPLWFDLKLTETLAAWSGRLVVDWPGIERSWWRWADRNTMTVHAIHEESPLVRAMPDWQKLVLDWRTLQILPISWQAALRQWRGIYYIFDRVLLKGYVGAAYGSENILGRWQNYASTGHGGNRLLRNCDPRNLHFSILQRLSPDTESNDVIAAEVMWKERLHTRSPLGLNDN